MSIYSNSVFTMFSVFFWPVLLVWLIVTVSYSSKYKKPSLFVGDGLMHAKLGGGQVFVITVLLVSLLAISERVLYDLTRTILGEGFNYVDDLQTIFVHAIFIIPVLALSIFINIFAGKQRNKYSIVLLPYFITSAILAIQLVFEISVYFSNHHTKIQLYAVLGAIVLIVSYAIWFVQHLYNQRLEAMKKSS